MSNNIGDRLKHMARIVLDEMFAIDAEDHIHSISTWQTISNDDGILLQKKYETNPKKKKTDLPYFRISTVINKPIEQLVSSIWNIDEIGAKRDTPSIISWTEHQTGNDWKICSQYNKMLWPMWDRHATFAQVKIEQKHKKYLVAFSIDHEDLPTDTKKYVRVKLHMSIYEYEALDNNVTKVIRTTLVDPAGSIPHSLIERSTNDMIKMFKRWKE